MHATQTAKRPRHRLYRAIVWPLSLVGLLLWGTAGVFAARALLQVEPAPPPGPPALRVLTVATVDNALPLSGTGADGRLGGVHVEVARAVCDYLGLSCRFALVEEAVLFERLETGAVDMIAADVRVSAETRRRARFAPPHGRTASVVVGPTALWGSEPALVTGPPGTSVAALSGHLVAVASGSSQASALRSLAPPDAGVVLAPDHAAALAALRRGEADAVMLPLAIALAAIDRDDGGAGLLTVLAGPLYREGAGGAVALALAPGDRRLARAVADALDDLRRSGRLRAITGRSADPLWGIASAVDAGAMP